MAVLQTIRTKAAGLLIGTLGFALLAFILSDLFSSGSRILNKFQDNAFSVDGQVVSTGDYTSRIEEMKLIEKYKTGNSSLGEDQEAKIRDQVYQQMVVEIMLDNQSQKLGLAVTAEELKDMVYGSVVYQGLMNPREYPWFADQQTGQFDRQALNQFLVAVNADPSSLNEEQRATQAAQQQIWHYIENRIKYQRLSEKYASLLARSVLVGETEAQASFNDQKNVANIAYVVQPYTSFTDSVTVTDKEIKELYEKRKNNFKLDTEVAKVSYFIKDVVPSEEDYAAVEKEINDVKSKLEAAANPAPIVNQYSSEQYADVFYRITNLPPDAKNFAESSTVGSIYGPVRDNQAFVMYKIVDKAVAADSVKLQMIQVPEPFVANNPSSVADSLVKVVKGGKDFAAVAKEVNPGMPSYEAQWVNEFELFRNQISSCLTAPVGDIIKLPIGGGQGTLLVKVVAKNNPVSKVKLAVIHMPVAVSEKTQNGIDNELAQFLSQNGNLENFDKAAKEKGYGLAENAILYPSQPSLANASGSRPVIHWAFNEKNGTVKKFDLSDKRIIAIIKEKIEPGYTPVSELSEMLKAELVRDKKAEKMIADLKAKNLTSLEAYAEALKSKVDTAKFVTFQTTDISGLRYEPLMNVYSKLGQLNKLEGPLKGQQGVYALSVIEKTEDSRPYDAKQIKAGISQNNYYQLMQQSFETLRSKMDVKDNRIKFF